MNDQLHCVDVCAIGGGMGAPASPFPTGASRSDRLKDKARQNPRDTCRESEGSCIMLLRPTQLDRPILTRHDRF
jgi:hypothetical protein